MPMELFVHEPGCQWQADKCSCTPRMFTDYQEALEAHGGDSRRLQLGKVTPPPRRPWPQREYQPRSQVDRHRAISY